MLLPRGIKLYPYKVVFEGIVPFETITYADTLENAKKLALSEYRSRFGSDVESIKKLTGDAAIACDPQGYGSPYIIVNFGAYRKAVDNAGGYVYSWEYLITQGDKTKFSE
jgi:hypothetical protein